MRTLGMQSIGRIKAAASVKFAGIRPVNIPAQQADTFVKSAKQTVYRSGPDFTYTLKEAFEAYLGKFIKIAANQKDDYLNAVEKVSKNTGAEFHRKDMEKFAVKSLDSLMEKFRKKVDFGTDTLRTTIFMKDPGNDYHKVVSAMEKEGYKVWINPETGAKDIDNLFIKPKDSGYKHVAIKFVKNDRDPIVKELQILTGPNALQAKEVEHKIYDVKKVVNRYEELYATSGSFDNEDFSRITKTLTGLSRKIYDRAYALDKPHVNGSMQYNLTRNNIAKSYAFIDEPVSLSAKEVKLINSSLRGIEKGLLHEFTKSTPKFSQESRHKAMTAFRESSVHEEFSAFKKNVLNLMEEYKEPSIDIPFPVTEIKLLREPKAKNLESALAGFGNQG